MNKSLEGVVVVDPPRDEREAKKWVLPAKGKGKADEGEDNAGEGKGPKGRGQGLSLPDGMQIDDFCSPPKELNMHDTGAWAPNSEFNNQSKQFKGQQFESKQSKHAIKGSNQSKQSKSEIHRKPSEPR